MSDSDTPRGLSIRVVSELTGIPAETIRTWERRYNVVEPERDSAGRRSYTGDQVERLRQIADLSDRGERVSELARLTHEELVERVRLHAPRGAGEPPDRVAAALVHPNQDLGLAGVLPDMVTRLDLAESGPVDVLVVDRESLGDDPVVRLAALRETWRPAAVVITFHYMTRVLRNQLAGADVRFVKAPVAASELRRAVIEHAVRHVDDASPEEPTDVPAMRFDRPTLEGLLEARPNLLCECPTHLAHLVLALREFELYSAQCASETPEDAALHTDLATETGKARALMEVCLARVCAHDGIKI